MGTLSELEQPMPVVERSTRPYPPSWVDHFTDWVNRLPLPPWVFYLCLWLVLIIVESGSKWLDRTEPFGKLRWISILYTFYGVYFLAAIHYLDIWAKTAFAALRPTLIVGEAEQSLLSYQLTTMPARAVWLLSAIAIAIQILLIRPLIMPLWEAMGFTHNSTGAMLVDLGFFIFNGLAIAVFIYHSLRQLRWGTRVYHDATRINIFQLRPLYALSGLTARTAVILLFVGYIIRQQPGTHGVLTNNPYAIRMGDLFTLGTLVGYSVLAVAIFILPLVGLHDLLLKEKERLQAEADSRLQAHILELHRRMDAGQLQEADKINYFMNSLSLEREMLAKLPTWPWQPGTLNLFITAVLLPIILWSLQKLLERWAGF